MGGGRRVRRRGEASSASRGARQATSEARGKITRARLVMHVTSALPAAQVRRGSESFLWLSKARHRSRFAVAAARPGGTPPRKDRGTNTGTRRGHRKVSWVRMSQHSRIPPRRGALSVVHESLKYRQLAAARGAARADRGGGMQAAAAAGGRLSSGGRQRRAAQRFLEVIFDPQGAASGQSVD